jgi:hypothetical protein
MGRVPSRGPSQTALAEPASKSIYILSSTGRIEPFGREILSIWAIGRATTPPDMYIIRPSQKGQILARNGLFAFFHSMRDTKPELFASCPIVIVRYTGIPNKNNFLH